MVMLMTGATNIFFVNLRLLLNDFHVVCRSDFPVEAT